MSETSGNVPEPPTVTDVLDVAWLGEISNPTYYSRLLGETNEAVNNLVSQVSALDVDKSRGSIVVVGGKSQFLAKELWDVIRSRLPDDHPIKSNNQIIQFSNSENAAIYDKYQTLDHLGILGLVSRDKRLQDKVKRKYPEDILAGVAQSQGVTIKLDNKPNVFFFEENANSGGKVTEIISRLRDNGYPAYGVVLAAMEKDYEERQREHIYFSSEQRDSEKYVLVGKRDSWLQWQWGTFSNYRSQQAEEILDQRVNKKEPISVILTKIKNIIKPNSTNSGVEKNREIRQYMRDYVRNLCFNLGTMQNSETTTNQNQSSSVSGQQ